MDPKESRRARKQQEQNSSEKYNRNGLNKVYYIVIGVLFLILLGLIIFLFTREDNDINLENEDEASLIEDATENAVETPEEVTEDTTEDSADNQTDEETVPDEDTPEENDDSTAEEGETVVVDEDAPYDPSHDVNYNEGSADLTEITEQAMSATGLDNLTQWWIEYDGPAQVVATIANTSQSEFYDVYLQYGDGTWHVTRYERLANNPFN